MSQCLSHCVIACVHTVTVCVIFHVMVYVTLCHSVHYTLSQCVHSMSPYVFHLVPHLVIPTGQPRYLSSLFLAGSSLSEDVSQFDFSTGAHVIPSLHPHQQSYNRNTHVSCHGYVEKFYAVLLLLLLL